MRHYAAERGIWLFGDIPIFVAHDSADVTAVKEFELIEELEGITAEAIAKLENGGS